MTPRQKQFFSALPSLWQAPLLSTCSKPEIERLIAFLQERETQGATIYPAKQNILAALRATPFDRVSVVIVGQDPYHGPGQAHGLSFSVPQGMPLPPSLKNIFKELKRDIAATQPQTGNLTAWADQGVLLLNALLTVEAGKPASHAGKGWEIFTDDIIEAILGRAHPTVLMLWGAYAQKKVAHLTTQLDLSRHLILKAAHPSPLSVRGFLGCSHFSQANAFLKKHGLPAISWNL